MKSLILFALSALIIGLTACVNHQKVESIGLSIDDVGDPVIGLGGTWKWSSDLSGDFWSEDTDRTGWSNIEVPGEPAMQGFEVIYNKPFAYATRVPIPSDFKGQDILLRFDGVYSYARLWVNGVLIREHKGGFTRWYGEITDAVEPGEEALLVLEVTDEKDDISYGSGYAHHPIGGILRNVYLVARPGSFPEEFNLETRLANEYRDGELTIHFQITTVENGHLAFELSDPQGRIVASENFDFDKATGTSSGITTIPVEDVFTWDAEHPHLYTLVTEYRKKGGMIWRKVDKVGFREIKIDGNRMLVNGQPVKLRGACRHDIHPTLGRVADRYYDSLDVVLAREANINFIRTSHYPPSEDFVRFCDANGIYVECETAVCFVQTHRKPGFVSDRAQSNPEYADQFQLQLEEMVGTFRNNPSVILWSLGNESSYGKNLQDGYDWIKSADLTRPVIFSYPGTVPDSVLVFDLLSMHYPSEKGDIGSQFGISMEGFNSGNIININDEWAHVPCYNIETLKRDPNVRDFWGQSLDIMWQNAYGAEGCLGGAIWGFVDETFMLPDSCVGYGEWGIIDTWRRRKPEFWNTKKAYSPVKVLKTNFTAEDGVASIEIPVQNRFDHTNFKELTIQCNGVDVEDLKGVHPDVAPGQTSVILLPLDGSEGAIELTFRDQRSQLIDRYILTPDEQEPAVRPIEVEVSGEWTLDERDEAVIFESEAIHVELDKESGMIGAVNWNDSPVLFDGPYLRLITQGREIRYSLTAIEDICSEWSPGSLEYEINGQALEIESTGLAGKTPVSWHITISASGNMTVDYSADVKSGKRVAEFGIYFLVPANLNRLSWERDAYWTCYPEQHLSPIAGDILIYPEDGQQPSTYRLKPTVEWAMDTRNFFLYGPVGAETDRPLMPIAKASKEHILRYALRDSKSGSGITVWSDGKVSCRTMGISETENMLFANTQWDYVNLSWGNYTKKIFIDGMQTGRLEFSIGPVEDE